MVMAKKHPMTRRELLRGTAAGMLTLAMGSPKRVNPAAKPPNVVFILADDLGYADVSCYGRPDLNTPNIDSIARRGVRFLQAYANSAVCSATRTALITGRYQYRLPVGLEEPLAGNDNVGLPPEHPTLPSILTNDPGGQMASGHAPKVWSAEERLRPFLWLSRRSP